MSACHVYDMLPINILIFLWLWYKECLPDFFTALLSKSALTR